jgi:hypothetical protein
VGLLPMATVRSQRAAALQQLHCGASRAIEGVAGVGVWQPGAALGRDNFWLRMGASGRGTAIMHAPSTRAAENESARA